MTSPTAITARSRAGLWVVAICFVTIVFDGYDLIVYGAVVPSLLKNPDWHLTAGQAGAIGSYALTGMVIGTLCVGALTDIVGRRRIMFASIIWFSLAMGATAMAPSAEAASASAEWSRPRSHSPSSTRRRTAGTSTTL